MVIRPPIQRTLSSTLCGLMLLITTDSSLNADEISFARDVRPLLADRCFSCHGPDSAGREADLRFDQQEHLLRDRGGYQVVTPKNPDASELVQRIFSEDESEIMPPPEFGKPLSAAERNLLKQWVTDGAVWQQHWAYERPKSAPIPNTSGSPVGNHWVDAFIAKKLDDAGTRFSPEANRITLMRRLSFDLTGLPTSPNDVTRLAPHSDAIERYIDRLLASPQFGERMASYWLDLVRFADTVGYHGDQDHNISPYRDYVINAFNDNLRFDQFTIDQLAGDLLDDPTEEQITATGYNRLLQTSHEGGVQPKEYLAIYAADRVRNVSAVWMGATVGCAQCHDHKYDPFTSHDFYALSAFFADIDEDQHFKVGTNSLPTKRPPERRVWSRSQRLRKQQIEIELKTLRESSADPAQATVAATTIAPLESELKQLNQTGIATMITLAKEPREVRFLPRGNWMDDSGKVVSPAIPTFLGSVARQDRRANRLDLARWLTDPDQGAGLLTARIFVNRIWMLMFGSGISRSVEDFGGQGEAPTHPELLDRLTVDFVTSGWDIKRLIRTIVTSRTYRQSSLESDWHRAHDPENRLFSRQNRFRLPAEMVRDTYLDAAQLLVRQVGGPSVKPYQPSGYYRHLNFPVRTYQPSSDSGQWRRGVYVHWQRQFLHPMLKAFDAPTREECSAQRARSNTPLAALVALNDPSSIEAARELAANTLLTAHHSSESRIHALFERVTCRPPDDSETRSLLHLLELAESNYRSDPAAARKFLGIGLERRASDAVPTEPWTIEIAAWTNVARAVLNLSETITRN